MDPKNNGTVGTYVNDVTKIIDQDGEILRETAIFGEHCHWMLVSGSPCQDLTYAGQYNGLFGVVGSRSVFFIVSQYIIWWISVRSGSEIIQSGSSVKMQARCKIDIRT